MNLLARETSIKQQLLNIYGIQRFVYEASRKIYLFVIYLPSAFYQCLETVDSNVFII